MSYLQLKEISKSYGKIQVLNQLSLEVNQGTTVAILGKSGSGKSTLLSILAGLVPPDSGLVNIDKESLWNRPPRDITIYRGINIGIIFQDYHLIPSLTAEENIGLSLYVQNQNAVDTSEALYWLDKVGLSDRKGHFPHQLSGGEQQRVAIARALAGKPKILLADEPTGSLDESTAKSIEDLIFSLVEETGMTTLLITHNPSLAQRCQHQYLLHQGNLASQ